MEKLLRDGGDLDSMDRSLLDYNGQKQQAQLQAHLNSMQNNHSFQSPLPPPALMDSLPSCTSPPPLNGNGSSGNGALATPTNVGTPICSPTSYISDNGAAVGDFLPGGGGVSPTTVTNQIMKREMVVRFTEGGERVQSTVLSGAQQPVAQQQPAAVAAAAPPSASNHHPNEVVTTKAATSKSGVVTTSIERASPVDDLDAADLVGSGK